MADHDLIVLGGGTGNIVADAAADSGIDTALVEAGPLGGTCLNRGCNPSKKLIERANVVETVRNAEAIGVSATVEDVAYADIVEDVMETIDTAAAEKRARTREADDLTLFQSEGRFVDDKTVEVAGDEDAGGQRLSAERIVLAGGSRPMIPDSIDGTRDTPFLTSDDALRVTSRPESLVIVGGGYIAVELAHFFGQMGTDVTIVGHSEVLLGREDDDVARHLTEVYRQRHDLRLGFEATEFRDQGDERVVVAESSDDGTITVRGERLLVATGRRPNTDRWNVDATDIETDEKGYVETDAHLETSVDGVYAIGDIIGRYPYKHSGDKEAEYVVENVVRDRPACVEYPGMAHAVFGSPQVASLGQTESNIDDDVDFTVGTCDYDETALGSALRNHGGFAKVLVGTEDAILGCHVVGPEASTLVHEVSTAVAADADARTVAETIHVHPALSEVVQGAFRDALDVAPTGV